MRENLKSREIAIEDRATKNPGGIARVVTRRSSRAFFQWTTASTTTREEREGLGVSLHSLVAFGSNLTDPQFIPHRTPLLLCPCKRSISFFASSVAFVYRFYLSISVLSSCASCIILIIFSSHFFHF